MLKTLNLRTYLFFLFMMCCHFFYGQSSFNIRVNSDLGGVVGRKIIQTHDSGYAYLATFYFGNVSSPTNLGATFSRYNKDGHQMSEWIYMDTVAFDVNDILELPDHGFMICGYHEYNNYGGLLLKTDSSGNLLWSKNYGAANGDLFRTFAPTPYGFLVSGATTSFGHPSGSSTYAYYLEADTAGNILKTYSHGVFGDQIDAKKLLPAIGGGWLSAGSHYSAGYDFYICRMDTGGNVLWSKSIGGTSDEYFAGVAVTSDSSYLICGSTRSFGNTTNGCLMVSKINSSGNLLWSKVYGGNIFPYPGSMTSTPDGGCVITDQRSPGMGTSDLIKLDSSGAVVWDRAMDGGAFDVTAYTDCSMDFNGNFLITGASDSATEQRGLFIRMNDIDGLFCFEDPGNIGIDSAVTVHANNISLLSNSGGAVQSIDLSPSHGIKAIRVCDLNGIESINPGNEISISPNPSSGEFNVELPYSSIDGKISIVDISGKIVYTEKFDASHINVHLANGIYVLRIEAGRKIYFSKLVINN